MFNDFSSSLLCVCSYLRTNERKRRRGVRMDRTEEREKRNVWTQAKKNRPFQQTAREREWRCRSFDQIFRRKKRMSGEEVRCVWTYIYNFRAFRFPFWSRWSLLFKVLQRKRKRKLSIIRMRKPKRSLLTHRSVQAWMSSRSNIKQVEKIDLFASTHEQLNCFISDWNSIRTECLLIRLSLSLFLLSCLRLTCVANVWTNHLWRW